MVIPLLLKPLLLAVDCPAFGIIIAIGNNFESSAGMEFWHYFF